MSNRNVRRLALAAGLFCAGMGAAQAQVVISQVYGGGGNSGATLRNDFIELRNNGTVAVDVSTWSVQYASATGASWQRTNLVGSIPAGGYYLIQEAQGAGGTTALPTPNAIGTIPMAGGAGKVALVTNQVSLTVACPTANVADFVGFGATANCFEGAAPTAAPSNTTSVLRKNAGAQDTNQNGDDFATGTPDPRNGDSTPPPPVDPPIALTIHQVQGAGLASPYADKRVIVEGIVTALKFNNGFFLQAHDADADADSDTSEGVFVFTSSAPTVAVGDRVKVTGKVQEYTPSTNLNQLSITEIVEPSIEKVSSGNALPVIVALGAYDLSTSATPGTLERLEGMRVSLAEAVVVGASDGRITETTATASTDGVFYVTLPDVAVPFREPGIGVMDAIAIPAGKNPPRFDTNQERLMVRSRGQVGANALALDNEAIVAGLSGVLDYFDGTWALLPDAATPPQAVGGKTPIYVAPAKHEEATIGGFNLLRFFDEVNDSNGAPTLTPAALDFRLGKTARAICEGLQAPDILGVVEVENMHVLQLLSERIDATCAVAPHYVPYLVQGNDPGGINVGVLASTRDNGAGVPRVEIVDVTQFGKDATFANPNATTSLLNDRPPLLVRTVIHQDNGASYPVSVIVNHLRSLNGVDDSTPGSNGWSSEGARVRGKRAAQAAYLAGLVQELETQNPSERFVLVGDFNAFEFNDGYVDVMGVVKGTPVADDQVLTAIASPLTTPLLDGKDFVADPNERYSYVFEGNAQTLDHALLNQAVVDSALHVEVDHARINADFGVHHFGDATLPIRVSDHDPVRVRIAVPAFRSADLRTTLSAPATAHPGQVVHFDAAVSNAGPNDAENASVAFVFDGAWSPSTTAPGWACDAPVQDAATTTVICRNPVFASGAAADFDIDVAVPQAMAVGTLKLAASAASSITDPANADNGATASVAIAAQANLIAAITGSTLPVKAGAKTQAPVRVRNTGPDAMWQPTMTLTGDVPAGLVTLAVPAGWSCTTINAGTGFQSNCQYGDWLAAGQMQTFPVSIVVPGPPGRTITLTVQVASPTTPDSRPQDDTATAVLRVAR
ncbi:Nuclease [Lysobacter dokdonensis DS-58]|uniref:Nuclease n=1 Tax=Lysobacter dokdonensis DS-58 TaxID=1300345 RepID=A0A0A2WGL5_9GAMM|nr:lamin tail domain-containing protein [Lysobacter dokdonensis]KGQ17847.1 Nuclease [Lysobacter dokdonensis DS-58]